MKDMLLTLFRRYNGIFFAGKTAGIKQEIDVLPYSFRLIEPLRFEADPIFAEKDRAKKFRRRCKEGHSCYGFFSSNGSVASYVWVSFSPGSPVSVPWIFKLKIALKPNIAYVWDCFTAPEHRKKGLYKYGLLNIKYIYAARGAGKMFIFCKKSNKASVAGITAAGFKPAFDFSVIKAGFICLIKKPGMPLKLVKSNAEFDIIGNNKGAEYEAGN